MEYRNLALGSNSELGAKTIIDEMVKKGYMKENTCTVSMLIYNFYIPDFDIIVPPLSLEMHYPKYDDNRIQY